MLLRVLDATPTLLLVRIAAASIAGAQIGEQGTW